MFFIRTEERVITRKELLDRKDSHMPTVYLTSAICNCKNGKLEYISGTSIIQKKWEPYELVYRDTSTETADIISLLMSRACKLIDDPDDLAIIHKIIEETAADCKSWPNAEEESCLIPLHANGKDFNSNVLTQLKKRLYKIYQQEYCRLVWDESIRYTVDMRTYCPNETRFDITSGPELKSKAIEDFFGGEDNRYWRGVNAAFELKMLKFPETMAIIKLKEYFKATARLLQAKTVFESDMRRNPFSAFGGPVYDAEDIINRLGTRLVEAVQVFGWNLEENKCHNAAYKLEKIQQLQAEIHKISDPNVKNLTKEALGKLEQHMDILKLYFNIWDAYIEDIICGEQSIDAYIENAGCAAPGADDSDNPWLTARKN